jgi:hypothetical protein
LKQHQDLLSQLSLEQLEEALNCLYRDQNPLDQKLQELQVRDWGLLHELLLMLLKEKDGSSLH